MGESAIEWTDATWNPVTGCDRVSPGCAHCYALDLAARLKGMGQKRYQRDGDPKTSGPGFGVTLHPDKLNEPLRWKKPRRVFVNSMSDLFHEEIPDDYIGQVFATMRDAPQHIFQVLTKRPERMRDFVASEVWKRISFVHGNSIQPAFPVWPLPNVWLGTSIENRRFVGRADLLRETPAAVRFISAEPLLGPLVNLDNYYEKTRAVGTATKIMEMRCPHGSSHPKSGHCGVRGCPFHDKPTPLDLTDIDWLIVGGESGPKRRPVKEEWVRDLRDLCLSYRGNHEPGEQWTVSADGGGISHVVYEPRTAFFFKQWGGRTPKAGGRELDGRTWDEFPQAREQVRS